ncbi:hypothetical protein AtDm6_1334 [Acetobacter tropicalis]|uniref:Uncharacterized protein n=1 Tax=Acetobacter tropicalis TaxID=104102 RepID=A0A095B4Q0_9PROT|nr:hypothetical protein AtDm6_1334 [Acetobacter tropicalis]
MELRRIRTYTPPPDKRHLKQDRVVISNQINSIQKAKG